MFDPTKTLERQVLNNGKNWTIYKYYAETYAFSIQARKIINGKEPRPVRPQALRTEPPPTPAEIAVYNQRVYDIEIEQEDWDKRDMKMFTFLRMTQSEDTMCHLRPMEDNDETGAQKAWKLLCDHFESKTRASIKQMLYKQIHLRQNGTLPHFLDEANRACALLKAAVAQTKLDPFELITQMVILDGLKPEFDQFKQTLLFDDSLTLDELNARLLEAGERLRFEGEIDASRVSMQALAVQQAGRGGRVWAYQERCVPPLQEGGAYKGAVLHSAPRAKAEKRQEG